MGGTVDGLRGVRERARRLAADYGAAAAQFGRNAALENVFIAKGADWLREKLDLPSEETRKAGAALRAQWKQTPTYRQFQADANGLIDDAKGLLRQVYATPPALTDIHRAVMPDTKAIRLEAELTCAIDGAEAWVAGGRTLPILRSRAARPRQRRVRARSNGRLQRRWLEWLGAIGGVASIIGVLITISLAYLRVELAIVVAAGGLVSLAVLAQLLFAVLRPRKRR